MKKQMTPAISFRPKEESKKTIEEVMKTEKLNQTDAINYVLALHGKKGNCNPYYRGLLAKYSMDMESALNTAEKTGNVSEARKVLGELLCQML